MDTHSQSPHDDLQQAMTIAIAPVHKRALGVAMGLTFGTLVAGMTALAIVLRAETDLNLGLLANYFYGYRVTWPGAAIGFWWAFVAGFAAGWFVAFVRNLFTALWIFFVRTKAELSQNFLDHI
jgi:hypothetical protein